MITFQDKVAINENPDISSINKITASDMNSIKAGVNTNETNISNIKSAMAYSTTEVKTDKVWIDGKPIYRKVVPVDFPQGSLTIISYPHGISNIEMITDYRLVWYDTGDAKWFNYFKDTTGTYYIEIDGISSTQVKIKSSSSAVNWHTRTRNRYAIIEYTKTTDVAP